MSLVERFYNEASRLFFYFKHKDERFWILRGEKKALHLFKKMATRVPAYKDFLQKHGVNYRSVNTIDDFKKVPLVNKENYLLRYELQDLCWDGALSERQWTISSTSGSSGEPFYFPRNSFQDRQFSFTAEVFLSETFELKKKSTLFVDCFALGVWIGGMFFYQAIKYIIDKNKYNISIITPGADKVEALKLITRIGKHFDQIVIGGYGPLVKDLIDDGRNQGIEWSDYNIRYFFAAEGFTEGFRDYIVKKGGVKSGPYLGTMNHYGTADLGTMSNETPFTILLRRLAVKNEAFYNKIFSEDYRIPTLTQYIPELFYFEEVDGRLVCSGEGGFPLVRYDLKDRGGIMRVSEAIRMCLDYKIDVYEEMRKLGISTTLLNLPLVYLYERDDFTVAIYSVNIYPECIRRALQIETLEDTVTGKFYMFVDFNEEQNQYLQICVELLRGVEKSEEIKKHILASVIDFLYKENSEWRDFYNDDGIKDKIVPIIELCDYQDERYFKPGGKQTWVKKKS